MRVMIINGPNLNLLGEREEAIYGNISFDDYLKKMAVDFPEIQFEYYQSNIEGKLISKLHALDVSYDIVLLNAGGYTHTSIAIADAVASVKTPVIEVHISNVYAREEYRHQSLMAKSCRGVIAGFGLDSYKMAIRSFLK